MNPLRKEYDPKLRPCCSKDRLPSEEEHPELIKPRLPTPTLAKKKLQNQISATNHPEQKSTQILKNNNNNNSEALRRPVSTNKRHQNQPQCQNDNKKTLDRIKQQEGNPARNSRRSRHEKSSSSHNSPNSKLKSCRSEKQMLKPVDKLCQGCREGGAAEAVLKYRAETLKTTFLKQELQRLKEKISRLKNEKNILIEQNTNYVKEPIVEGRPRNKKQSSRQKQQEKEQQLVKPRKKIVYNFPHLRLAQDGKDLCLQTEICRLRKELQASAPDIEKLYNSIYVIMCNFRDNKSRMDEELGKKERERNKLEKELREFRETAQSSDQRIKTVSAKLKKSLCRNTELEDEIEELKQQLKHSKTLLEQYKEDNVGVDEDFSKLRKQYTELVQEHQLVLKKQNEAKNSNLRLEELRRQMEQEFEKNLQELELLTQENKYLRIENDKIKAKRAEQDRMIEQLQEQAQDLRHRCSLQKEKREKTKLKLEQQYQNNVQELHHVEAVETRIMKLTRENEALRQNQEQATRDLAELRATLKIRDEEVRKLVREREDLAGESDRNTLQLQELRKEVGELRRANENYRNRLLDMKRKSTAEEEAEEHREHKLRALADIQHLIRKHRHYEL